MTWSATLPRKKRSAAKAGSASFRLSAERCLAYALWGRLPEGVILLEEALADPAATKERLIGLRGQRRTRAA
jgi:hypothetical protein